MSYVVHLIGKIHLDRPLAPEHLAYLTAFCEIRHMKRDVEKMSGMPDPLREAVGLPLGPEGAFYVGDGKYEYGTGDPSVLDYNREPDLFPGLNSDWGLTDNGSALVCWTDTPRNYEHWLRYLIREFFRPWGYTLQGLLRIEGEDSSDFGFLVVDGKQVYRE